MGRLNGKRLLVLGGFPQMIDIVMSARSMGVYVLVVDRDVDSPAKRFADKAVCMSTADLDGLTELCHKEQVQGVFCGFEDFNIHIACELCQRLGLPFYATKDQIAIVTNKLHFKAECRKHGIPVIEQCSLEDALRQAKYPYIIKPADSYGSRGITVCHNKEELVRGYSKAREASSTQTGIIERFVDSSYGTELFYTIVNGRIRLTATADRHTVKIGGTSVPLPVAEVFPSRHESEMKCLLDPKIQSMLRTINIKNGLVSIQALYEDGEFFVYEMAYRLTGEQHYRLVAKQHGVDLGKMMICLALGEDISEYDTQLLDTDAFRYPSINLALILKPGRIARLEGLDKVYQIDEVISYNLTHKEQDVIAANGDYSQMLIRINMVAETYSHLKHAIQKVNGFVEVLDENGEDMLVSRFELPER